MGSKEEVSAKFSFEGWRIGQWLLGNKESVKLIISVVAGLIMPGNLAVKTIVGAIAKLITDSIDFYCTEVKI